MCNTNRVVYFSAIPFARNAAAALERYAFEKRTAAAKNLLAFAITCVPF
jgi:hypothetical protein